VSPEEEVKNQYFEAEGAVMDSGDGHRFGSLAAR